MKLLYLNLHKLWRMHQRLIRTGGFFVNLAVLMLYVYSVAPNNILGEAVLLMLVGGLVFQLSLFAARKRWRVVLPVWVVLILVMNRFDMLDLGIFVVMLGALGLIAFIN